MSEAGELAPFYVRGDESVEGEFHPVSLGVAFAPVLDHAETVVETILEIGSNCDSPIEEYLGAAILIAFRDAGLPLKLCTMVDVDHQDDSLLLVPQFRWSIYRSDWAILKNRRDALALLIECDGQEFHSSPEQLAHDARKDATALERGHLTVRFTGSEIYRHPEDCAADVLRIVRGAE